MKLLIIVIISLISSSICYCEDAEVIIINKTVTVGPDLPGNDYDYHSINTAISTECSTDGGVKFIIYDNEYSENVSIIGDTWNNRSLILQSESRIPAGCIINGNNSNPCMYIRNANVSIRGFTIKNGKGKIDGQIHNDYHLGGGVLALPYSWLSIGNCIIKDNNTHSGTGINELAYGGGCFIRTSPESVHDRSLVTISNCQFYRNYANTEVGIPDPCDNCWGGAIFAVRFRSGSIIQFCKFEDNWADDYGGAIYLENSENVIIAYNQFYYNYTRNLKGEGTGMAFFAKDFEPTDGQLILRNNIICNNKDQYYGQHSQGVTVSIYNVNKSYITNNTIAHNDSAQKPTLVVHADDPDLPDCQVDIFNNILYGNNYGTYQMKLYGASVPPPPVTLTAEVAYNSIEGLWHYDQYSVVMWHMENFARNPYFVDININNFHIQPGLNSCVDTGVSPTDNPRFEDAYMTYSDIDMNRRPLNGDPLLPIQFDIGADEYKP